jgi:hypothetical protein
MVVEVAVNLEGLERGLGIRVETSAILRAERCVLLHGDKPGQRGLRADVDPLLVIVDVLDRLPVTGIAFGANLHAGFGAV